MLGEEDQVVLVTSPAHGSGVSAVAAQTALATGLMGAGSVLLVDANPHGNKANEHSIFASVSSPGAPGLSDVLTRNVALEQALIKTSVQTLDVLPLGTVGEGVPPLLSEECTTLFTSLREQYRFIFVDAPPMMQYPETAVFAPRSDGVLLVVPSGGMSRANVLAAKRTIEALEVPLFGWVLCDKSGRLKV